MYKKLLYALLFCIFISFTIDVVEEYRSGNSFKIIFINSLYKSIDFTISIGYLIKFCILNCISWIQKIVSQLNSYTYLFEPYDRTIRKLIISFALIALPLIFYNFKFKLFLIFLVISIILIIVLFIVSLVTTSWQKVNYVLYPMTSSYYFVKDKMSYVALPAKPTWLSLPSFNLSKYRLWNK